MKNVLILFCLSLMIGAQASASTDTDGDGLSDYVEQNSYFTDINSADTDGDGYSDPEEIANGYSPLAPGKLLSEVDTDKDGLIDAWELKLGTSLNNRDTDGDSFSDGQEIMNGFSPLNPRTEKISKKIIVDIANFTLSYFANGILLESVAVSTGRNGWPTPRGTFAVMNKVGSKNYGGGPYSFYYPNTKWNLHFTNKNGYRYYIHGAYWHNEFGKKNMSSGCVNVAYKDMEPLYTFAGIGTVIEIK